MTIFRDTFQPDAEAVDAVRADIENRLISALHYLVDELEPLPSDIAAACRKGLSKLTPATLDPALHGLYAQMRNAALNGDKVSFDAARLTFSLWNFDAAQPGRNGPPTIRSLAEEDYDSSRIRVLSAGFADDVGLTTELVAPSADVLARETRTIQHSLRVIAELTPDWSAELSKLVREIILATNSSAVPGRNFAGGSVFDLFGAILVNPNYRTDMPHYLMTLIHESSHLRLFCYHLDDEVVLNDDGARYHSPLRRQPRPMEGIFHAMWVSARMSAFGRSLLENAAARSLLSDEDVSLMQESIRSATTVFQDARGVVREHGKLTALGKQLVDDASQAIF